MARQRPSLKRKKEEQPELTLNVGEDLEINPDSLDIQWAELPMLIYKYGQALAKAEQRARDLDEKVKTVRSELIIEITDDPSSFGLDKATKDVVEACFRKQKEYIKVKKAHSAAQLEADSLRNVTFCLSAKRASLESLTRLLSMEYFSSNTDGGYLSEKLQTRKQARSKIKRKMNKGE